jgi:hypothetical protein
MTATSLVILVSCDASGDVVVTTTLSACVGGVAADFRAIPHADPTVAARNLGIGAQQP